MVWALSVCWLLLTTAQCCSPSTTEEQTGPRWDGHSVLCRAVHCTAVQCSALQCSALQCSVSQCCAVYFIGPRVSGRNVAQIWSHLVNGLWLLSQLVARRRRTSKIFAQKIFSLLNKFFYHIIILIDLINNYTFFTYTSKSALKLCKTHKYLYIDTSQANVF